MDKQKCNNINITQTIKLKYVFFSISSLNEFSIRKSNYFQIALNFQVFNQNEKGNKFSHKKKITEIATRKQNVT